ncbi:MAG: acylphosphatase [candidate division WOR-3 bacterium]|nr:acylphosphatase [candidate division WOR-3 bacterium]MCX7837277.1 acylphosphatase [candidate division WOR-3 bacterium]MDW8113719.1 acylphosphatase [candidate division WOR-3 bacterium]
MKKRVHIFVSGLVQGVFYRDFTRKQAKRFNILGWVRNLLDGRVEVVAEGEEENIKKFIEELKKGPPAARVESIEVKEEEPTLEFDDFEIIY